ncbi:MAG: hypothetical protein ACI9NY_000222 [Kiritimatiellia bacterium]|jgi:hypothetical protein
MPNTSTLFWPFEAKIDFFAKGDPVKLSINIPKSSNEYLIIEEFFSRENMVSFNLRASLIANRYGRLV